MNETATEKRVIKKYPNRRLYDTVESKYITLEDVRKLVLGGVPFCVVDKKTDEDITRNILLQIIIEREEAGEPLFSTDSLTQLISYYGDSMQGFAGSFLDRSLALFAEQQKAFRESFNEAVKNHPLNTLSELTQQNFTLWQRMQEDFLKAAGVSIQTGSKQGDEPGNGPK
jgi:polyhydroxyalkanoate synthesis repressor PhaR